MAVAPYFVSLHHEIRLEENLPAIGAWDGVALDLLQKARGVLMPKYFSPPRYRYVASLAQAHFPRLSTRYAYRGKTAQIRLFRRLGIPHPRSFIYTSPQQTLQADASCSLPLAYPFVLKGDSGGGGSAVFPVSDGAALQEGLCRLPPEEPVLLQERIKNPGRDLRVVLMGPLIRSYFRLGGDSFYNNVSKGARIDSGLLPEQQRQGRELARQAARTAGIDLAAFDIMFPPEGRPLIIEINFLFGTKGLGGSRGYSSLFRQAVQEWMESLS
jgi:ribosomal protein S6--L-glutamate ligase